MASLDMLPVNFIIDAGSQSLDCNEKKEDGESKVVEEHFMTSVDASKRCSHKEETGEEEANDVEHTMPSIDVSHKNIHHISSIY